MILDDPKLPRAPHPAASSEEQGPSSSSAALERFSSSSLVREDVAAEGQGELSRLLGEEHNDDDDDDRPDYSPPPYSPSAHLSPQASKPRSAWVRLGISLLVAVLVLALACSVYAVVFGRARSSRRPSSPPSSSSSRPPSKTKQPWPTPPKPPTPPPSRPPPSEPSGRPRWKPPLVGGNAWGRPWASDRPLPPAEHGDPIICNSYPPPGSWAYDDDATKDENGLSSSTASFLLPIVHIDELFLQFDIPDKAQVMSDVLIERQPAHKTKVENAALIKIVAMYRDEAMRDSVQVCLMVRGNDEGNSPKRAGIGLYPTRESDVAFSITITLPPHHHIPVLAADSLVVANFTMSDSVEAKAHSWDHIVLRNFIGIAWFQDVWTQVVEVNSLFGGVWLENVIIKNSLALEMHLGGVASKSGLLLAPRSRTTISTLSRGRIILPNITLLADVGMEDPTISSAVSIKIESEEGKVDVGFHEQESFAVPLHLIVGSNIGSIRAFPLPPSYTGLIHAYSRVGSIEHLFSAHSTPDPRGLHRRPHFTLRESGWPRAELEADIEWPGVDEGRDGGVVELKCGVGGIAVGLATDDGREL